MFEVRVKPGHPSGTYRRAGKVFTTTAAVLLDEVPDVIRNDPWLVVTEADPAKAKAAASESGDEDLAALLESLGAESVAQARQAVELHLQFDEQRDDELAKLKTDLAARKEQIGKLEEAVTVGAQGIADLGKQIKERDVRIEELEKALGEATKKKGARGGSSD